MPRQKRDILERAVQTLAEQAKADALVDEATAAGGGSHASYQRCNCGGQGS